GPGLSASASAATDVVEPLLSIDKAGSIGSGEAGDLVVFTITVEHQSASTAEAQNVTFQDVLPADLLYVPGSLSIAGFVPSGSDDSGGVITVDWDSLPLGQSATITYEATLVPGVITGTSVVNTGDLDWTSLVDSGDPH